MGLFDYLSSLFRGSRQESEAEHEEAVRAAFKARCKHFKALLSANKRALGAMANLEDAMRGERFFNMSFVRGQCTTMVTNVFNMVRHLNALSDNAHAGLRDQLKIIQKPIGEILAPKQVESNLPLVLPIEQANFAQVFEVGGKMASLGEAKRSFGQNIPSGFVITSAGFRYFMNETGLQDEVNRRFQMMDQASLANMFSTSAVIRAQIEQTFVPEKLAQAIQEKVAGVVRELGQNAGNARFAVRSSAVGEDSLGVSFAGQFSSELNVTADGVLAAFRRVVASKYGVSALSYRYRRGIADEDMPMSVGVIAMVDAVCGGVAYSVDPLRKNGPVVINAVWGLPKTVVDGTAAIDTFAVNRDVPMTITERTIGEKREKTICSPTEGLCTVPLEAHEVSAPCLGDEQIIEVANVAVGMEVFYGVPQDIEWAYTRDGRFVLLQSRPLLDAEMDSHRIEPYMGTARLLASGGVCVSPGGASGPVHLVRREDDLLTFPQGGVLVVENAHAHWASVLGRACAVLTEYGGAAGHLASVAREYGVPALFGVEGACGLAENGQIVSVDADNRRVLEGEVENLTPAVKPRKLFVGSPVHKLLGRVVSHIVPLNLLNPESSEFVPSSCRTLHDIIRYCHEKSVEEMFRVDESIFAERCGRQLKYNGAALQYFVVNIDHGFCSPAQGRYISLEEICCKPMLAIWEGMVAVPWSLPQGSGARGFMSIVSESACNPELEITNPSMRLTRNYFLVDRDYCSLQASFGYHFCAVEAQAGEDAHENFVSFHFKGGAANLGRRKQRISALSDVLSECGFIVDVKEDTLSAMAEELSAKDAHVLLRILGYLIIHSRQIDATLHNRELREAFADTLRTGIAQVRGTDNAAETIAETTS